MVAVTHVITSITSVFTFHMCWISSMRSLYFKIFPASFFVTFLSPGIATSINMHVPLSLSRIMMSSLLLGIVLSVHTCWFHNITLPSWLISTDFGTWSYQCSLSNFTPVYLDMLKCSWAHTLSCLFLYCSLPILGMLLWCIPLSRQIVYRVCVCCLFLFVIFLSHDIWFVMPDLVLLLFHIQFLFQVFPRQL